MSSLAAVDARLNELVDGCWNATLELKYPTETLAMGGYLHLEVSEFIEALRGKRGNPESEAADILFQLFSMIRKHNLNISNVLWNLQEQVR